MKKPPISKPLTARTARRYRARGVDTTDPKAVADAILAQGHTPETVLPERNAPMAALHPTGATGSAAQAGRLESDIVTLRFRLQEAAASGEAVLERTTRRQLLHTEEALRRLYADRGDIGPAGELIQRSEAEDAFRAFCYAVRLASKSVSEGVAAALVRGGAPDLEAREVAGTLCKNRLLLAARNLFNPDIPGLCCPPWALAVIQAELSNQFKAGELKTFLEDKKHD